MALNIVTFILGALENNTYLVADPATKTAAVIDPSFGSEILIDEANGRGWKISAIWLTHAHFDHIAGINALERAAGLSLPVGLHALDLPLYTQQGGARLFQLELEAGPEPQVDFSDRQELFLGEERFQILHTPGHTPGHVTLYAPGSSAAFCGDIIFQRSIGRTDLPGGSSTVLLSSIRQRLFILPPETRLLPGHGPETTVREEKAENPFL